MRCILTRLLAVLTLLAALQIAARAEILVYRGTLRVKPSLDVAGFFPPVVRAFLVVDYETGELALVSYYTKGTRQQLINEYTMSVINSSFPNGRPATVLSRVQPPPAPPTVTHNMLSLRGTNVALRFRTTPTLGDLARPRVLNGTSLSVNGVDGGTGSFGDFQITFSFNSALTLDANNNSKTFAQVRDGISATLTAQGYELP